MERGRTREDWLPRRLGGGKGDSRRDREEEKMIRELKKSHPLLKDKSRSRSRDKNIEDKKESTQVNKDESNHRRGERDRREKSKSRDRQA